MSACLLEVDGQLHDLHDAVVIDVQRFERTESRQAADTVGQMNAKLRRERRPYLLIGVGRWESSEPFLGIPVTWDQISGARVIVEAGFRDLQVTPSQGTHFFHNLTSNNVGYFTVNPELGEGFLDWDWLLSQPLEDETGPVRHLRFDAPIVVKMNGRRHEGVIEKSSRAARGAPHRRGASPWPRGAQRPSPEERAIPSLRPR